ncbi:kin of IRRE-like protein 3 [Paramacrobiotus metropolitanus]|uniref:kin of IRRE-like protein 3 n=1 Tax=Paramacrobiotus metropolitanus TaxID=2943436 RepID=UPI002446096B|nr:kin of IRRE-like protein 3 [Paramacrobiotus metropolitanus]XP_055331425.1 kin of IRRE-like protein 3 [Paramacrobiotus metropolitanus]
MVNLDNIQYLVATHVSFIVTFVLIAEARSDSARFIDHPQSVSARLGEDVSLRCTIYPPAIEVLWFLNGFPLQPLPNSTIEEKQNKATGEHELIMKNISVQRDGQYYCRQRTEEVKSQTAQVTVLVAPSQIRLLPFNPVTIVQENVETSLTCHVDGGKPAPTVQWYKDDVLIETGVDTHIASTDLTSKTENVTSMLKWTPIRGEHEKRIFCTASHTALQGGILRVETQLIVEYPPVVTFASVPKVIKEGDSVTLQCIVDANPYIDLKFRWKKNDLPIYPDVSGGTLYMEHVQRSDRGTVYTCEATNRIGTGSAGYTFTVQYPPGFYSMQEIYSSDLNADTYLACNVDSSEPADIIWTHESSSQVIGHEKILQVHATSDSDFGVYSCTATAPGYPAIRKDIKLLKKGPPFISAEASVYAGQEDSQTQIKCVINGLPLTMQIRWINPQGRTLLTDQHVEIAQETLSDRVVSRLTIKNVKKDDFGMYNCSAANAYGSSDRLIPLKETDWMLPIIIGCACGGTLLLLVIVAAILCVRCRSHRRLKRTSDTSGSTTTSDDLETKGPNGGANTNSAILDMYNTSSSETLHDGKLHANGGWHSSLTHTSPQDILHAHPYTIHADYMQHKDAQNFYTRYADYEQEYNPNTFLNLPAIYTPTLSIEQQEQEGSRDPSPYQTSGLPIRLPEPLYTQRFPNGINGSVMMLDATLNSRLATNV